MIVDKRGTLCQFDLVIYPVESVIVIGDLEEEVNKLYEPYNENYNYIAPPTKTGEVYNVKQKSTGIPCVLMWIGKINEFTGSIVAHEAGHVAMEIFRYIGATVSLEEQEPFCYLLGNIARLAIGQFYEIPGIKPPVVSHDAFCNSSKKKSNIKAKK